MNFAPSIFILPKEQKPTASFMRWKLSTVFVFLLVTVIQSHLSGCTAPSQFLTIAQLKEELPEPVQISTKDGRVFELETYVIAQTEIIGNGSEITIYGKQPFSGRIPLRTVTLILNPQAQRASSSALTTVLIVLGGLGLLYLLIMIIALSNWR